MNIEAKMHELSDLLMSETGAGDFELHVPREVFRRLADQISILSRYQPGGYVYPLKSIEMYSYSGRITVKEVK